MKQSEDTFLFRYLAEHLSRWMSRDSRFLDFAPLIRQRIVSFATACCIMFMAGLSWTTLSPLAFVLPDNWLGNFVYVSSLYGCLCFTFWACWVLLTRLSHLWSYLPANMFGSLVISGVILMWILLAIPENGPQADNTRYGMVLAWALTCLRPALFAGNAQNHPQ